MSTISNSNSENGLVCDSPKTEIIQLPPKDELSAIMECTYCLDMLFPPVYQCATGHLVCSICREKLKKCGLCLCKSAFTGTRCFFYENLFEKMTFACKYVAEGCKEVMLMGKFVKEHQEHCAFRPICCVMFGCENRRKCIAYSKYLKHYQDIHQFLVIHSQGGIVYKKNDTADGTNNSHWLHEIYQFKGYNFFLNCQVRQQQVGIWLWLLGTDGDAKNFRVKISLGDSSNTDSDGAIACWEGPVHSIRKAWESIMDDGQCLSTTLNAVKGLCGVDKIWKFEFLIKEHNKNAQSGQLKPKTVRWKL